MNKPSFQDIAWALTPYIKDADTLLRATNYIEALYDNYIPTTLESPDGNATFDGVRWNYAKDYLVMKCLGSNEIMRYVAERRKIQAIKELQQITRCGLKDAKEAIEDRRVVWIDNKGNKTYGNGEYVPNPETNEYW